MNQDYVEISGLLLSLHFLLLLLSSFCLNLSFCVLASFSHWSFTVFFLYCLSVFFISFCLFSLPPLSFLSLSALICSFLHVVPPAGFLHQSHSPTYLSLPLLIFAAQPLCLSLLTFLIHSALCNTDVPPDLFGLFSAVCY